MEKAKMEEFSKHGFSEIEVKKFRKVKKALNDWNDSLGRGEDLPEPEIVKNLSVEEYDRFTDWARINFDLKARETFGERNEKLK